MKKTNSAYLLATLITCLFVPSVAFAIEFNSLGNLIGSFTTTVVKALGTLFMALAVVAFLWGIASYIWAIREGKEADINNGKQFMMWGLIALFVMFSVYGIVKWAQTQIGLPDTTTIKIPDINFGGSGSDVNPNNVRSVRVGSCRTDLGLAGSYVDGICTPEGDQ